MKRLLDFFAHIAVLNYILLHTLQAHSTAHPDSDRHSGDKFISTAKTFVKKKEKPLLKIYFYDLKINFYDPKINFNIVY